MPKKVFVPAFFIILLLSSGPFYYPFVFALDGYLITQSSLSSRMVHDSRLDRTGMNDFSNVTLTQDNGLNRTAVKIEEAAIPLVVAYASPAKGNSPLYVEFTGFSSKSNILVYKWDFDGDGDSDYASLDSGNTSYVYVVASAKRFTARFTVVYSDRTEHHVEVPIEVSPIIDEDWFEIKDLGTTTFGLHTNGTIYMWDERDLIPLNFFKGNRVLRNPSYKSIDKTISSQPSFNDAIYDHAGMNESIKEYPLINQTSDGYEREIETYSRPPAKIQIASKLTYQADGRLLDVTLYWGVMGRVLFNFTEYLPSGLKPDVRDREITLPKEAVSGKINFRYKSDIEKASEGQYVWDIKTSTSLKSQPYNAFYSYSTYPFNIFGDFPEVDSAGSNLVFTSNGGDPVWGQGGSEYSPWKDQGLVPYGEYFNNLKEHVSTQTGFLTIIQTDLLLPGRGLDLEIKRVYAPPSTFEDDQPASAPDYSYQDYPWVPIGNGWQLGFPWIETESGNPAYIHLSNGQRYEYNNTGTGGKEYHSGDHFKLYKYSNDNHTLYTVDGVRYSFDSSNKLIRITDPTGNNQITFSYNGNNKISTITDTVGRTVSFSYNGNGLVSQITSASRTIKYSYTAGSVSGYKLVEAEDPAGRSTKYDYYRDYLITKIEYPSGGNSVYQYGSYLASTYDRYRVVSQRIYDGKFQYLRNDYKHQGNFYSVDEITIKESEGSEIKKTTHLDYTQEDTFNETVWDGTESDTRIHKIVRTFEDTRRRILVEKYPGDSTSHVDEVLRYDDWGNLVFSSDFENHNSYFSYINTDSTDEFVNSQGQKVTYFTDSFYENSVNSDIHIHPVGIAEYQDGAGSPMIETYYKYSPEGDLEESKRLLSGNWLRTKHAYDDYGNRIKTIDPNNHNTYFEYNSSYYSAYLTSVKRLLEDVSDVNLTRRYCYDFNTGLLTRVVDEKGNKTDYTYDVIGRITNVTHPVIDGIRAEKSAVYNDTITYSNPTSSVSTVSTTTSGVATWWTRTNTFDSDGRSWVFWYNGNIVFTSSEEGSSWDSPTVIPNTASQGAWDIFFDGAYVHLVETRGVDEHDIYYRRGAPHDDGTITWGSRYKAVDVDDERGRNLDVTVTDNYVWLSYEIRFNSENKDIFVTCSTDMDGGWSTRSGFPYKMDDCECHPDGKIVPLTEDKVYVAWIHDASQSLPWAYIEGNLWDGASWQGTEMLDDEASDYPYSTIDFVAWDNDVWMFRTQDSNEYAYAYKRTYSTGSWGSYTSIFLMGEDGQSVQLSKGEKHGTLYAWYTVGGSGEGVYYRYYNGSSWEDVQTLHLDSLAFDRAYSLSTSPQAWEGKISVVYTGETESPYKIRHNYLPLKKIASESSVKIYDENDNVVKHYYDGLARLKRNERYNGTVLYSNENYTYNWLGKVDTWTTPENNEYRYEYDALGQITKSINPDETYGQITYNYNNNVHEIRDEEDRKKKLKYDWMERLINVKEYNTTTNYYHTQFEYDEVNNLIKITDAKSRITNYQYDQLNRITRIDYPDNTYETMSYDAAGNIKCIKSKNGTYTHNQYDSLNRLINISYSYTQNPPQNNDWIEGWAYRKEITISGSSAGPQTDYQIRVKVHHGFGTDSSSEIYCNYSSRKDFGDIRFTKNDGTTILDYWIQEKTDESNAIFWVEVDQISYPSNTTIYMYYGNPAVTTTESGDNTWIEYEDWETYSVDDVLPQGDFEPEDVLEVCKVNDNLAFKGSQSLYFDDDDISQGNFVLWNFTDKTSGGYRFLITIYQDTQYDRENYGWAMHVKNDWGWSCISLDHDSEFNLRDYYSWQWHDTGEDVPEDEWHVIEINSVIDADTWDLRCNGDWVYNRTKQSALNKFECIQFVASNNAGKLRGNLDVCSIGKYCDPEPYIADVGQESTNKRVTHTYDATGNRISSKWDGTLITRGYDARNRLIKEKFNVFGEIFSVEYDYDNSSNVVSMAYPDDSTLDMQYDALNRIKSLGNIAHLKYTMEDKIDTISYGNNLTTQYLYNKMGRPSRIIVDRNLTDNSWQTEWLYRKKVTISGSTAGAQTNYQIMFKVHYGSGVDSAPDIYCNSNCRTDFGDIRFTKSDGTTFLDYWIESKSDGNKAVMWVEIDSIPANPGAVDIYIYYGNECASSESDASETFSFFDDFPGTSLNTSKWTQDYTKGDGGTVDVANSILTLTAGNDNSAIAIKSDTTYSPPYAFRSRSKIPNDQGQHLGMYYWLNQYPASASYTDELFAVFLNGFGVDRTYEADLISYAYDGINWNNDNYQIFEIRRNTNGDSDFYVNDIVRDNDHDCSTSEATIIRAVAYHEYGVIYVDWVLIRKYVQPEPSVSSIETEVFENESLLLDLYYKYDKSGSVTEIIIGSNNETYSYDLIDRLTETTGPWGTISYTYDEVGNRLKKTAGSTTSYAYDNMNRLTSATGMSFDWDENGNMVYMHDGSDAWNYSYDPEDRLLSVKKNGALQSWFSYDADGRRVRIADGQSTLFHVYSGLDIIYEKEGATATRHYYANGLHIAEDRGGTVEYYHQDHLGSTRLKTNSTGGVVYEANYVPFGPAHGESGSEEFKYTGKHKDPSGLYYYGARYYDPETGRFITEDPVTGSLDDPQGLNKYSYCRNNPHKFIDPDGELAFAAIAVLAYNAFMGGIAGSTLSIGTHVAVSYASGKAPTAEGIIKAGFSGFLTGAVAAVATPIGGWVAQKIGAATGGIIAKSTSYALQAVADVGAYCTETIIADKSFNWLEMGERVVISAGISYGTNWIVGTTMGMNTISQLEYFAPRTSDAFYDAVLNPNNAGAYNARILLASQAVSSYAHSIYKEISESLGSETVVYFKDEVPI